MTNVLSVLSWYLAIQALGWLAFPIARRFFRRLPDRGYSLSKALGLLLWGFVFWALVSLRIAQNDLGGVTLALGVVGLASVLYARKIGWSQLGRFIREERKTILSVELIFLVAFLLWAFIRSTDPVISGTEKPMELAFINSILRSPSFTPTDPWFSGYGISYYYFGYVLIAMLIRITGVASGIGFNLAAALWFALTAAGAYGILFNLIASWQQHKKSGAQTGGTPLARFGALAAPIFLLIVSNVEGFLELLHARGLFWKADASGTLTSRFWSWLNILELDLPPVQPFSWNPQRPGGILWWRGSRVLSDWTVSGGRVEIIDEFPFFTYLLSDLHPHMLAMPFSLIAIGLALNLFLTQSDGSRLFSDLKLGHWLKREEFWFAALVLGGMGFLNTWEFPLYVGLMGMVFLYGRIRFAGYTPGRLLEFLGVCLSLGVAGGLVYLPFYLSLSMPSTSLLPSMEFITRGVHYWVMFLPLLVPIFAWVMVEFFRREKPVSAIPGLKFAIVFFGGLTVLSFLTGLVGLNLGSLAGAAGGPLSEKLAYLAGLFLSAHGGNGDTAIIQAVTRRFLTPGTWLTLFLLCVLVWSLLAKKASKATLKTLPVEETDHPAADPSGFVLLLALLGAGLTLFPEYFYLLDGFGTRMNTIFKFYFMAWMVWSLAAAFGFVVILTRSSGKIGGILLRVGLIAALLIGVCYPVLMLQAKTGKIHFENLTLDGEEYIKTGNPDEYFAMQWLRQAPAGVVVEAVGGSYTGYARMSTHSGQPTVLGWPGHESQWRSIVQEISIRDNDVRTIYATNSWDEALDLLQRYDVRYIVIGNLERATYHVVDAKFQGVLQPVYETNTLVIYEVPESLRRADSLLP